MLPFDTLSPDEMEQFRLLALDIALTFGHSHIIDELGCASAPNHLIAFHILSLVGPALSHVDRERLVALVNKPLDN